jgi:hypothetical protein
MVDQHGGTVLATKEETTMKSKIACATLSLAIALSGASVAFAGGKKETADPRINTISLAKKSKGSMQDWCDIDSNCNGWAKWIASQGHKG